MNIRRTLENYCDTATLWEVFDEMTEILGTTEMLESLAKAMGTDELQDNLEYIARQWDL